MSLKKLLPVLLVLCSSMASSAENDQPPPKEQASPATEKQSSSSPPETPPPADKEENQADNLKPLPSSTEMTSSYEGAFVRMLVTLLGLVFLVFATFWILRRLGKGQFKMGSGRSINILEKRALSPKSILYIVEIGQKKVLISESQVEVRALTTFEEPPEVGD